jgi:hypothetical protein
MVLCRRSKRSRVICHRVVKHGVVRVIRRRRGVRGGCRSRGGKVVVWGTVGGVDVGVLGVLGILVGAFGARMRVPGAVIRVCEVGIEVAVDG